MIYIFLILAIGTLTTFTDFNNRKIYNIHLLAGFILGLIIATYTNIFKHEDILPHIYNGSIAFFIGFILNRCNLWKGGDAKLYTLLAFLMPPIKEENMLLPNAIYLFESSFIMGSMIILPIFIKDMILNYQTILTNLLSPRKRSDLLKALTITLYLSWILFPAYYLLRIIHNPIASLLLTFIIFTLARRVPRIVERNLIIEVCIIIFGLIVRLWLAPSSLSWQAITVSFLSIILFSIASTCIYAMLEHFKEYHDRIPFAPLLFLGCLISYTPFFAWITHALHRS